MRKFIIGACLTLSCISAGAQAVTVNSTGGYGQDGSVINADYSMYKSADGSAMPDSTTLFEDVRLMSGSDGNVSKLGKVAAGEYELILTDFEFPQMFEELKVAVTTATRVVSVVTLNSDFRSMSDVFELAANECYYLSVFGTTASSSTYGLYGVKLAQYSPVPVPASALLLLSGLFAWGVSSARRKQVL